mmetsp:Transcript_246/g.327  ORF Transcript_246/g.327 Transcript_246/m.327 type:complete len:352 (+) Transcript_246:84-1139(+)
MPFDKEANSYSAFSAVDSLVSKPVLGSDGAASWQQFRKSNTTNSRGVAPHMPLKKADKLGTGFKSIDEERRHEENMREEGNDAKMNSGYTNFKRKVDRAEIEEKKRRKMVEERIRPEKAKYFISAATFEGWKEDYIFTTRDRGIGYYWDGMDSVKKLLGKDDWDVGVISGLKEGSSADMDKSKKQKKKKKKKKKVKSEGDEVSNHNPMEQIINAMRRRNEILSGPRQPATSESTAQTAIMGDTKTILSGSKSTSSTQFEHSSSEIQNLSALLSKYKWEVATDPSSGKPYYFSRQTGTRQWDNPLEKLISEENSRPKDDALLPDGWRAIKDAVGKTYYYHRESGKTSWEKPS